ncbi:MAG TPA: polysaccharide deacetylase family protein [Gemmatimonadaceae bacterium]|nr:polysaccharide deacetylase family protein [Gemmatimonadaceae bacterium]
MRGILTYHSLDESGSPISIEPRVFRSQMEFLARGKPRVVPLADVVRPDAPDETVALTFDDAFANFHELAAPLLADLGLPATLFVVTDHVGRDNNWASAHQAHVTVPSLALMSWDDLEDVTRRGVEIGAHSRRHPHLTTLRPAALADEVHGSAERIRAMLGARPTSFAYPYGDVNDTVASAVRSAYQRACTTQLRALAIGDDPARLPRLDAYYFRAEGQLEQWGTPAFQRRLWLRAQARRVRGLVSAAAQRV